MPFGEYKNFDECVRKNKDKRNPEAYCAEIKRKVEKMAEHDWQYDLEFQKIGDKGGHMYLAGFASNGDEDEDSQHMDMDSLKSVYQKYMKNPIIKFMHDSSPQWKGAIGKVIEKYTDSEDKVWETSFGAKPFLVIKLSKSPKLEWLRGMIEEGMFSGLSIGGKAKEITKEGKIIVRSWLETSIVDVPSAKGSFLQVLKAACTDGNCPAIVKGEMSAEDKKKERKEDAKSEEGAETKAKEQIDEPKKKPNKTVQKFISSIDKFEGDIMTNEINGFCKIADDFLKGGPGSGIKGHMTKKVVKGKAGKVDKEVYEFSDRKKALQKFNALLDKGKIVTMSYAGKKSAITKKVEKYNVITAWD